MGRKHLHHHDKGHHDCLEDFMEGEIPGEFIVDSMDTIIGHSNHIMSVALGLTQLMVKVGEHNESNPGESVLSFFDQAMRAVLEHSPQGE